MCTVHAHPAIAAYDRGVTSVPITDDETASAASDSESSDAVGAHEGVQISQIVRRRLAPSMPDDGLFSWAATLLVVVIGGALRFLGLSHPPGKIFDEVYYATEGHDMLVHGVEWNTTTRTGDFVVHPPLGKWLIGFGEWLFKYNEFGWRVMPAVAGTLSILILIRVARRMFRSTVLGLAAGLLLTLDGMEFVLSRTALLDIFLMFFVLAAFACLVLDRDARRKRWLTALEAGLDPTAPGRAGRLRTPLTRSIPWWRLGAAVLIGCAMSVKWSAIWYIILFVILMLAWEIGTRRSAGVPHPVRDTLLDETGWITAFGLILVGVYIASWSGWLLTDHGYDRHYLQATGHRELPYIGALRNLWHYHMDALNFHDGLTAKHLYQSWPWQWLLLGRPVAFYYSPDGGCGAANCSAEVLLLGTPLLWWSFIPALLGTAALGIARRDWRAIAIFFGAVMGIAPWLPWELDHRTMFYFYAAPAVPFLVLAVVYVFGALMRGPNPPVPGRFFDRQIYGAIAFGVYLLIIAWCFAYFYPLYIGEKIPYNDWYHHLWLDTRWI